MTRLAVVSCLLWSATAVADAAPYKVWWSFPNDDDTAIEVDEPDLEMSRWEGQRWKFAVEMQRCDARKSKLLAQHKDGTPVREVRVDALEPDGKVRSTVRCVMTLADWRKRFGKHMTYRLDDELDAHAAFLMPRRGPGMPPKVPLDEAGGAAPKGARKPVDDVTRPVEDVKRSSDEVKKPSDEVKKPADGGSR